MSRNLERIRGIAKSGVFEVKDEAVVGCGVGEMGEVPLSDVKYR